jgi:predicted Zn finger-like uncharacterized protein
MDVTCDRCKTRYEFDAALVSSRGTTVKCTTCGHQFRVFRPAGSGGLTGWTVRRGDGSELRFLAMRELQSAIGSGGVMEADLLMPDDGSAPQTLGAIEELRSFFRSSSSLAPTSGGPTDEGDTTKRQRREAAGGVASVGGRGPNSLPASIAPMSTAVPMSAAVPMTTAVPMQAAGSLPLPSATPPLSAATPSLPRTTPSPSSTRIPLPAPKPPRMPVSPDDIDMLETNPQLPKIDLAALGGAKLGSTSIGFPNPVRPPPPKRTTQDSQPPVDDGPEQPFRGPDLESDVRDALARVSIAIRESTPPRDSDPGSPRPQSTQAPPEPTTFDSERTTKRASLSPSEVSAASEPSSDRISQELTPASVARPSVLRRSDGGDPRFSEYGRRSSRTGGGGFGRWAIGVVVLGVAGFVGVTMLRKAGDSKPASTTVDDGRVGRLLGEGDALLNEGDVDGAKEQFAKASGLAESDPRVLNALAKVAVVQADRAWLRGKLAGKDLDELARLAERAQRAVDAATRASGGNGTSPLEVDALRLKGKLQEARKLTPKLSSNDPSTLRALATLDLCEAEPPWDGLVERLRSAAAAEKKLGQAQATLAYALARRGQTDAAKREIEKLGDYDPTLVAALRDFVGKATEAPTAASSSSGDAASELADLLKRARAAQKKAHHDEAEKLFRKLLEKSPSSVDGLLGVAETARARGDATAAEKRFKEVVEAAPDNGTALGALGDLRWQRGDKAGAVEFYRQLLDRAPQAAQAEHARKRVTDFEKATAPPPAAPPPAAAKPATKPVTKPVGKPSAKPTSKPATKPKVTPPKSLPGQPEIDTTDLPD